MCGCNALLLVMLAHVDEWFDFHLRHCHTNYLSPHIPHHGAYQLNNAHTYPQTFFQHMANQFGDDICQIWIYYANWKFEDFSHYQASHYWPTVQIKIYFFLNPKQTFMHKHMSVLSVLDWHFALVFIHFSHIVVLTVVLYPSSPCCCSMWGCGN